MTGPPIGRRSQATTVRVRCTEFVSSEDGQELIRRLEGFPTELLGMVAAQGRVVAPSQVDHLLAVIRPDRTGTVYVVATATLATFAGGGGLGDIIVNEPTYGVPGVIAGSLAITALAFIIDGLLALIQRASTPRPLRKRGRLGRADVVTAAAATEDLVIQQT